MKEKSMMQNDSTNPRPRASASGTIFGGVDCYVLGDGTTVLSQRGMLRGLRGKSGSEGGAEDGDLGRYLARLPEKYSGLSAAPFEFLAPDGNLAIGRPARDFVAMCRAYAEMYADGTIHKARVPIARNCIAILAGLADVGIDELVYRASGYRPATMIQTQPVDASLAMAQITALTALVTKLADNVGDMQQRLATGHAFASGTVSPMVGNGIKRRLHVMGQRLAACKAAKNVASGRQKQTVRLRAVVGWPGKWNGLPVAKEADCMRELGAMERAVDTIAAALNGGKQLVLAIDNTKRAA